MSRQARSAPALFQDAADAGVATARSLLSGTVPRGVCAAAAAKALSVFMDRPADAEMVELTQRWAAMPLQEQAEPENHIAELVELMQRWMAMTRPLLRHRACPPSVRAAITMTGARPPLHNGARAGAATWGERRAELLDHATSRPHELVDAPATRSAAAAVASCDISDARAALATLSLPAAILARLSSDPHSGVRLNAACNPSLCPAALAALVCDDDPGVSESARRHPRAPAAVSGQRGVPAT